MKIICIGLNYKAHIKEMGHDTPEVPIFFMKPDTALLRNNDDMFLPDFSSQVEYECELAIKINRVTKAISRKHAHRCYDEVAVGIDFTARDIQKEYGAQGLPWELAKAFDKSTPIPNKFVSLESLGKDVQDLDFHILINGKKAQAANSSDMLFSVDEIIEYVSRYVTLKIGDVILTGTPPGVGKVEIGDHIEAFLEDEKLLDFYIK